MLSSERPRPPLPRLPSEGRETRAVVRSDRADAGSSQSVLFEEVGSSPAPAAAAPPPAPVIDDRQHKERLARAEKEALARGRAEGQREAMAENTKLSQRMEGAFEYLHQALAAAETAMTKDAVRLALMIAEKVVRRSLGQDLEALASSVAGAAESLENSAEPLRVLCDPATALRLRTQFADLAATLKVSAVEIQEDPKLAAGDFMLYRGSSTLDARLSARLERIERALVRELKLEVREDEGG